DVGRGVFREGVFFRLSVVTIKLPPLRERAEDIPLLAEHFLKLVADSRGLPAARLEDAVVDRLTAHDWPGNVRELKNVIERAVLLSAVRPGHRLEIGPLHASQKPDRDAPAPPASEAFDPALSFSESKERWLSGKEAGYVQWLLNAHDGNVSAAARAAKMDRKYLHRLVKKHAITP
ncbi:unnamed protein product, partial [Laminaria digitata]